MKVQGSQEMVKPIEILGNKVLFRTNIERVVKDDESGTREYWEYDEEKISKDEYISILSENNENMDLVLTDIIQLLIDKEVI